jgi:hypothetical protein
VLEDLFSGERKLVCSVGRPYGAPPGVALRGRRLFPFAVVGSSKGSPIGVGSITSRVRRPGPPEGGRTGAVDMDLS